MNICITGALGHIGSKLIRELPTEHIDKIHIVDNMRNQRYCSLFDLPDRNYVFHQTDILSTDMNNIIKDSNIVIHLAAISDAEASVNNPILVEQVNIKGLQNIINLCSQYQVKLFFPSTTSVYGGVNKNFSEDCNEKGYQPQSPYAHSKLRGEKMIQQSNLKYVIFRLGTIFGFSIGMRFNTAVNKFLFQAASGQGISVWKTARYQKRPYCDLIDAIAAINNVIFNNLFDCEIYNIVTVNLTVDDILKSIQKYIPRVYISYTDSKIMNTLSYDVDNTKSKNNGFTYEGSLDISVKELIEKFQYVNIRVKNSL